MSFRIGIGILDIISCGTQFSDLTDEEFETQHMGGYNKKSPGLAAATKSLAAPATRAVQLPEFMD